MRFLMRSPIFLILFTVFSLLSFGVTAIAQETCPPGTNCDPTPSLNCPSGSYYDEKTQVCVPELDCGSGYFYNKEKMHCEQQKPSACPSGSYYDEKTQVCKPVPISCPSGSYYDEKTQVCKPELQQEPAPTLPKNKERKKENTSYLLSPGEVEYISKLVYQYLYEGPNHWGQKVLMEVMETCYNLSSDWIFESEALSAYGYIEDIIGGPDGRALHETRGKQRATMHWRCVCDNKAYRTQVQKEPLDDVFTCNTCADGRTARQPNVRCRH